MLVDEVQLFVYLTTLSELLFRRRRTTTTLQIIDHKNSALSVQHGRKELDFVICRDLNHGQSISPCTATLRKLSPCYSKSASQKMGNHMIRHFIVQFPHMDACYFQFKGRHVSTSIARKCVCKADKNLLPDPLVPENFFILPRLASHPNQPKLPRTPTILKATYRHIFNENVESPIQYI